jgi:hypothetical protein
MFKKIFAFVTVLIAMLVVTPLYAQDNTTETTDIREVKARYCNDPEKKEQTSLFIDAEIDKKSVICIDFINTASKKAKLGVNFVDGAVTDDTDQKKACLAE